MRRMPRAAAGGTVGAQRVFDRVQLGAAAGARDVGHRAGGEEDVAAGWSMCY